MQALFVQTMSGSRDNFSTSQMLRTPVLGQMLQGFQLVILAGDPSFPPSLYLCGHGHHSHDKTYQTFPHTVSDQNLDGGNEARTLPCFLGTFSNLHIPFNLYS